VANGVRLQVVLDRPVAEELQAFAEGLGMSVSQLLRTLLQQTLQGTPEQFVATCRAARGIRK